MLRSVFPISCLSCTNGNGFRKIYNETDIPDAPLYFMSTNIWDLRRRIIKRNALTSLCRLKTLWRRGLYTLPSNKQRAMAHNILLLTVWENTVRMCARDNVMFLLVFRYLLQHDISHFQWDLSLVSTFIYLSVMAWTLQIVSDNEIHRISYYI